MTGAFERLLDLLVARPTGRVHCYRVPSKLFAMWHAVERRMYSRYPDPVSIEKTERRKLELRRLRNDRKMFDRGLL